MSTAIVEARDRYLRSPIWNRLGRGLLTLAVIGMIPVGGLAGCRLVFSFEDAPTRDDGATADAREKTNDAALDVRRGDSSALPCEDETECDDGLPCTENRCESRTCRVFLRPDRCLIDEQCYPEYIFHPDDPCLQCEPGQAPLAWTQLGRCIRTIAGQYPDSLDSPGQLEGATDAVRFYFPTGLAVGPLGGVFVADSNTNRVRVIKNGMVSTYTGGEQDYKTGALDEALYWAPTGVAFDDTDRLWIADRNNRKIRVVDSNQVITYAGLDEEFKMPHAIAVGGSGEVYVADMGHHSIYLVENGEVTLLAGTPGVAGFADGEVEEAQFNTPTGIAVGINGEVYVADQGNHRVRVIHNGIVETLAGSGVSGAGVGTGAEAQFHTPAGLAVEGEVIYVADRGNNQIRIISQNAEVSVIAGSPLGMAGNQNGPGSTALFNHPVAVTLAPDGTLFVADYHGHVIRSITPAVP